MSLATLTTEIESIIQDTSILDITARINDATAMIAAGVLLPDGRTTKPLPELFQTDTVTTATDAAYVSLPDEYQRNLFYVADSSGERINPPRGGDLYSFMLFLKQIYKKDLTEAGSIYAVCVKGNNLYYQGIPAAAVDLTIHFYRKPVDIALTTASPDGIPSHLQRRLIVNYVCADIFGSMIENDTTNKMANTYHMNEFYRAGIDLVNFIGDNDDEPILHHGGNEGITDLGALY